MVTSGLPKPSTWAAWLWSGAGGLICIAMSRLEPSLLKEGLLLHVGERMLAGEYPYRDVVLTTGPVPYAMVGGLFTLFGPGITVARSHLLRFQSVRKSPGRSECLLVGRCENAA
ncbi:MAG: hypothetical protein GY772_03495 [bacterium]|nr:hypothetical protein [bacterium]